MTKDLDSLDQKEYNEFIKESVKDGSYFNDARDWYIFRYVLPICERSVLFFLALLSGITSYSLFLILENSLPMKEMVPITIVAKDTSLYFPVIKKLRDAEDLRSVDEAVVKYLLIKYLKEREEYDFRSANIEELNNKFSAIKNNSSADEYKSFQNFMSKDNAISPIYNFGKNITRTITIDSVNFKRMEITSIADRAKDFMSMDLPGEVEIRYKATIAEGGKISSQNYLTKISFKFSGIEQKKSKLAENNSPKKKLDFTVISYKTYKVN